MRRLLNDFGSNGVNIFQNWSDSSNSMTISSILSPMCIAWFSRQILQYKFFLTRPWFLALKIFCNFLNGYFSYSSPKMNVEFTKLVEIMKTKGMSKITHNIKIRYGKPCSIMWNMSQLNTIPSSWIWDLMHPQYLVPNLTCLYSMMWKHW